MRFGLDLSAEVLDELQLAFDFEMAVEVADVSFDGVRAEAIEIGDVVALVSIQQHRKDCSQAAYRTK